VPLNSSSSSSSSSSRLRVKKCARGVVCRACATTKVREKQNARGYVRVLHVVLSLSLFQKLRDAKKKKDLDFCPLVNRRWFFTHARNLRTLCVNVPLSGRSIVVSHRVSSKICLLHFFSPKKKGKSAAPENQTRERNEEATKTRGAHAHKHARTRARRREIHKNTRCRARRTTGSATKRTTTGSTNRNTRRNCTR